MTYVQVIGRKRNPETGERYRWRHGPFASFDAAEAFAKTQRATHARRVRVELVPFRETRVRLTHAGRTRAGMERARARGRHIGRPRAKLGLRRDRPEGVTLARAREIVKAWSDVHGRTKGLEIASRTLGVSVSTLERALRRPSKGGR